MEQGYNVFRALSPACPFDLCAIKEAEILRVEVTTGTRYRRGNAQTLGRFFSTPKVDRLLRGDFDALVVVFSDEVEVIRTEADAAKYRGYTDEEQVG